MATLQFMFIFIVVLGINAWPFGDKINVRFETKYDNNHNELKQLLAEHKTFKPNNWTHYALLIQLIAGSLVLLIILIYIYRRCGPILKIVCRGRQHTNYVNHLPSTSPSYYQPPYAHTPTPMFNQSLPKTNSLVLSPRNEPTTSLPIPPNPVVS